MTLEEALTAMEAALQPLTAEIPGLQIYPYLNNNPTPPSIDIYPAEPFQEGAGFGVGEKLVRWTVRARAALTDPQEANLILIRLMDCEHAASVEAALQDVAVVSNDGQVSGYRLYPDEVTGGLLGCEWQMEMFV